MMKIDNILSKTTVRISFVILLWTLVISSLASYGDEKEKINDKINQLTKRKLLCSKLILKHDGGIEGRDMKGNPQTRFQVSGSSGEKGCPPKNSIVDVRGHFYGDIKGILKGSLTPKSSHQLLKDTFLIVKNEFGETQKVQVIQVIPCAKKGFVGSGNFAGNRPTNLCCEGLEARDVFDVKNCNLLIGGYVCVDCGDGVCEKKLENYCNCPEDCPSN